MSNKPMRKVLFITRAFPPENASAVQRPLKFVKFLPQYGYKPYVVTPAKAVASADPGLTSDIPPEAEIHEVGSVAPAVLQARAQRRWPRGVAAVLSTLLLKLYSILYYRLYLIDWNDGWVPFGIAKAWQLSRHHDFELIFIDLEPPSSALIGLALKHLLAKPMVVDYHDPWTTSVYNRRGNSLRLRLAERIEGRLLRQAQAITAGKPLIIAEILAKFTSIDPSICHTITSGYDPDDFAGITPKPTAVFTVTYTGKISDKFYYSPETFLHAAAALIEAGVIAPDALRIQFVGSIAAAYQARYEALLDKLKLRHVVVNTGPVDHRTCLEYLLSSDLLLFILEALEGKALSYEFAGAIPSKLYEYIYTGKPILAITPPGFEAQLVTSTGTGRLAEPNDVASVTTVLATFYQNYQQGKLDLKPDPVQIARYNRQQLAADLAQVFRQAGRSAPTGTS